MRKGLRRPRGHADGAKLVGWEALKARDAAKTGAHAPRPFTDSDFTRTLRALGATLRPPTSPDGQWRVIRGTTTLATGRRPRTALHRATLLLHRQGLFAQ